MANFCFLWGNTSSACSYYLPFELLPLTEDVRYNDAKISIRRTNEPFNYQLLITRVFQEGEEELEQDLGSSRQTWTNSSDFLLQVRMRKYSLLMRSSVLRDKLARIVSR